MATQTTPPATTTHRLRGGFLTIIAVLFFFGITNWLTWLSLILWIGLLVTTFFKDNSFKDWGGWFPFLKFWKWSLRQIAIGALLVKTLGGVHELSYAISSGTQQGFMMGLSSILAFLTIPFLFVIGVLFAIRFYQATSRD